MRIAWLGQFSAQAPHRMQRSAVKRKSVGDGWSKLRNPNSRGVDTHHVPADFNALSAAKANITAKAAPGFLASNVLGVAEFHLLKGGATTFEIEERHLRTSQVHLGTGRDLEPIHSGAAYRDRRHFGLGYSGKIAVNGLGSALARANGLHHSGRAGGRRHRRRTLRGWMSPC